MTNLNPILLVEDNEKDEMLTRRALARSGIANEIVALRDGAEAVAYLVGPEAGSNALPAVVLLDLKLPKLDGHEVLRRLRAEERTRFVPVVILTSSDQEDDIVRGYEGGANSYVRKPVNFDDFVEAVRQVGLYWGLVNVLPAGGVHA